MGLLSLFLIISCKKTSNSTSPSTTDEIALQTTATTNAEDQSDLQNDDDAIAGDATSAAELSPGFGTFSAGNYATIGTFGITDTTYIDSTSLPGILIDKLAFRLKIPRIILKYKGWKDLTTGYIKTGKITMEIINSKKWVDAGAILKETYNVTITRGNKTRNYTGTRYVTNVSGGYRFIGLPNTSVYTMHAYDTVTFDNGSQRVCWVTRKNSFNKQALIFTTGGDSTINGSLCTIGGTTRFGKSFLVQAPQDIISSKDCGFDNPISGVRIHTSSTSSNSKQMVTITFGVDSLGNPITQGCAWGYKVNWLKLNGNQGTVTIKY